MAIEVTATPRGVQGRGASRRLRHGGRVPGVLYGAGKDAQNIELDHNELVQHLKQESFHASILSLSVDGEKQQVLLRDLQMHPWRAQVLHIDFQRVDATTKIAKKVPLHFINEENSPAVKTDKLLVNHVVTELLVQCLAAQLPEFIDVDLGNLQKGQSVHVDDVKLPTGAKVVTHGKKNPVIVSVSVQAAEEEAAPAPVVAAAEPAKKGKKDEKQNKK